MTEKNIFVYKLFFLLNTSDFKIAPRKDHLPLSRQPPSLFENLVGGSPPPPPSPAAESVRRAHYEPIDSDIKKDLKK